MRVLLAFAVIAGFLLTWTAAQQPACDFNLLVRCDAAFSDALQLPVNSNWHNPERFRLSVERYLQFPGVTGIVPVCRAFAQFKNCLGPVQYPACLNVPALVGGEVKVRPAYEYVKIWTQFHFSCGSGFNTFLNNDCMAITWQSQLQQITNCRHTFDSNVSQDPRNVCVFAREAVLCYETQFLQGCPTNSEPGWWACEYERIGTAIMYPQCGLRCSLPSAGGIGKK
jgi:hypothetical protein